MHPFDLRGPEFLVFYAVLAVVTVTALVLRRRALEAGAGVTLSDPYSIAYLRGGPLEAVRVAVASLVSRGLIRSSPFGLADGVTPEQVSSPLERSVLSASTPESHPRVVVANTVLHEAADGVRGALEAQGLLPDAAVRSARRRRLAGALAVLLGTAAIKIVVALGRGRTNVGFLVLMAVVAALVAVALAAPRRTRRGDLALEDLAQLLAHLRAPASGRVLDSSDAALVAAVFGLDAVPDAGWRDLHRSTGGAAPGSPSSSSCGTSSSCGSSGGSSCGGGGGGCGGGGCGGCGS